MKPGDRVTDLRPNPQTYEIAEVFRSRSGEKLLRLRPVDSAVKGRVIYLAKNQVELVRQV